MGLKIGEIAKRSGVPASTIRYYVKEGLLPSPSKPNKKMAYYDESCLEKLKAIGNLQEKRYYPLSLIRNILRRMDDGFSFEEAEAVENAVFAPLAGEEVDLVDRPELLRLTGLTEEQLVEVEKIGLVIPFLNDRGKAFYDQEDITVARDAVKQAYALGIDPRDFEFYVTLGHQITDQEVAFRRRLIKGMSSKGNAEVTTSLTRAANLFRSYILRRLFQQKIQTRIQRSLGRKAGA
jgi:DNA-binding transcriptional MerR regulator